MEVVSDPGTLLAASPGVTAAPTLDVPSWAWAALGVVLIGMIAIDLFAHRGDRVDSRRRAWMWSIIWIAVALAFNVAIAVWFGRAPAEQFLGAYLLEKSLSVDNLFVFIVIFAALGIPREEQHRVLMWGILGALVTRGLFIGLGAAAIARWHAVAYVFGGLLILTSLKLLLPHAKHSQNRLLGWLERHLPWTQTLHGHRFVAKVDGRWVATPLLLALLAIELTDIVFAIDSVPAAFAVTKEPFLVYSSNVFAILGLRALYIVLAASLVGLRYLRFGLAAVLAFAGVKMIGSQWFTVPPLLAVAVIVGCIGIAVAASVVANRRDKERTRSSARRAIPHAPAADPSSSR